MDLLKQLNEWIENGRFIHGRIYEIDLCVKKPLSYETIYGVCTGHNSFDKRNTWVKFDVITDAEKREVFYLNDSTIYRVLRIHEVKLKRFPNKTNAYYFE